MNYEAMMIDFYNYLLSKEYYKIPSYFRYGFYKKIMKWYFGKITEYRCRQLFILMVNKDMFYRIDPYGRKCYLYRVRYSDVDRDAGLVIFD